MKGGGGGVGDFCYIFSSIFFIYFYYFWDFNLDEGGSFFKENFFF